jgi:hypothetical protein
MAAIFGLIMIIGRLIYAIGYSYGGPNGRGIGALFVDVSLIGLFVLGIWSSINFIGNKSLGKI